MNEYKIFHLKAMGANILVLLIVLGLLGLSHADHIHHILCHHNIT